MKKATTLLLFLCAPLFAADPVPTPTPVPTPDVLAQARAQIVDLERQLEIVTRQRNDLAAAILEVQKKGEMQIGDLQQQVAALKPTPTPTVTPTPKAK